MYIYIYDSEAYMPKSWDSSKTGIQQNCVSFCKVPRLLPIRHLLSAPEFCRIWPTVPKEHGMGPLPAWLGYPMAVAVAMLSKAASLLFPLEFNKSFTPPKKANLWSKVEPLSCWCVSKKDEWIFA